MKKLISLILCLCFIFGFVGCGNKDKKSESDVDLEYYAKLGKIPEVEFTLGEDIEKVTDQLSALLEDEDENSSDDSHDHDQAEYRFEIVEGQNNVLLDNGTVGYYYNKVNKNNGVSYIVNYDTSFGFEKGTVSVEIKNALKGFEFEEADVSENNAFFATYISNGTVLETKINNVVIMFVFQENELYATVMYDANNWSF